MTFAQPFFTHICQNVKCGREFPSQSEYAKYCGLPCKEASARARRRVRSALGLSSASQEERALHADAALRADLKLLSTPAGRENLAWVQADAVKKGAISLNDVDLAVLDRVQEFLALPELPPQPGLLDVADHEQEALDEILGRKPLQKSALLIMEESSTTKPRGPSEPLLPEE